MLRPAHSLASLVIAAVVVLSGGVSAHASTSQRTVEFDYRSHAGHIRHAWVIVPAGYHDGTPIPLVISPHGRGVSGLTNARMWETLPSAGEFAVVSPDGDGNHLGRLSWGAPGQIRDLAKMPRLVERNLPWLKIDRRRIYALGGSMGGQETLLLVAKYPHLLAGAAAFDSDTDLVGRWKMFPLIPGEGGYVRGDARREIGGSPAQVPQEYKVRSPISYARQIAFSGVPLQLWWSNKDQVVLDQAGQSGALYLKIRRLNPQAQVTAFVGSWLHSTEMHKRMPAALARMGLLSPVYMNQTELPLPDYVVREYEQAAAQAVRHAEQHAAATRIGQIRVRRVSRFLSPYELAAALIAVILSLVVAAVALHGRWAALRRLASAGTERAETPAAGVPGSSAAPLQELDQELRERERKLERRAASVEERSRKLTRERRELQAAAKELAQQASNATPELAGEAPAAAQITSAAA